MLELIKKIKNTIDNQLLQLKESRKMVDKLTGKSD